MGNIQDELKGVGFPSRDWGVVNIIINRTFDNPTSSGEDQPLVTSANENRVLAEIAKYLAKKVGTVIKELKPSEPVVVHVEDKGTIWTRRAWKFARKRRIEVRLSWSHLVEVAKKKSLFSQIIFVTLTQA